MNKNRFVLNLIFISCVSSLKDMIIRCMKSIYIFLTWGEYADLCWQCCLVGIFSKIIWVEKTKVKCCKQSAFDHWKLSTWIECTFIITCYMTILTQRLTQDFHTHLNNTQMNKFKLSGAHLVSLNFSLLHNVA